MLCLSRKLGETIVIGEGAGRAVVTVVEIDRGKVRLGIEALRNIPVHRGEIAAAIERDGKRGGDRDPFLPPKETPA
jgi:carbon storage regulator